MGRIIWAYGWDILAIPGAYVELFHEPEDLTFKYIHSDDRNTRLSKWATVLYLYKNLKGEIGMKQGVLLYDEATGRYDIRFGLEEYYGGLHCGATFDVNIGRSWVPTRIEKASDWYLVGVKTDKLDGLRVRLH